MLILCMAGKFVQETADGNRMRKITRNNIIIFEFYWKWREGMNLYHNLERVLN